MKFLRETGWDAYGLEDGLAKDCLLSAGLGLAHEWPKETGKFDVISAIEVVEHLLDPIEFLVQIERFLAPSGVFFITTGNFAKVRKLLTWRYVIPEVHVTYWTPVAWANALEKAGLSICDKFVFDSRVVQYKIMKNLSKIQPILFKSRLLWSPVSRIVDRLYGVSEFVYATKASP